VPPGLNEIRSLSVDETATALLDTGNTTGTAATFGMINEKDANPPTTTTITALVARIMRRYFGFMPRYPPLS
jgi:hypothetical protein